MQWLQDPNQSNVHDLNNLRRAGSSHFRKQKEGISKIYELELTSRSKISETCIGASMTLGSVTSLELIQQRMIMVIWL